MSTEHIVRSFAHELERLSNLITQMGGVAEAQVDAAVKAVARRDVALAAQVMQADQRIDAYERDIDAEAVRLLALRQPLAQDLREIVSALKIASDLERIGDYASNIAKRSLALAQVPVVRPAAAIPRIQCRTAPAEKEVPSPSSTTARTPGSVLAASRAAVSAPISAGSKALCSCGRFRRRRNTGPAGSISSGSAITSSLGKNRFG